MCFGLIGFSLLSFCTVLCFQEYKLRTSFERFILKYCTIFDVTVNKIIFIISFFNYSLLLGRNCVDFFILTSYFATLMNSLVLTGFSGCLWIFFLCIFKQTVFLLPVKSDVFHFSFLFNCPK